MLHIALSTRPLNRIALVRWQLLLEQGAEPNRQNAGGYAALHDSIIGRHSLVASCLIHNGAEYHHYLENGQLSAADVENLKFGQPTLEVLPLSPNPASRATHVVSRRQCVPLTPRWAPCRSSRSLSEGPGTQLDLQLATL